MVLAIGVIEGKMVCVVRFGVGKACKVLEASAVGDTVIVVLVAVIDTIVGYEVMIVGYEVMIGGYEFMIGGYEFIWLLTSDTWVEVVIVVYSGPVSVAA